MIFLDENTTLEVVLAGAVTTNDVQWNCSAVDSHGDASSPPKMADVRMPTNNKGTVSGTTPAEMMGAPSSGFGRWVKEISVYNADTVDADIIIQKNVSGTRTIIYRRTRSTLQALVFSE